MLNFGIFDRPVSAYFQKHKFLYLNALSLATHLPQDLFQDAMQGLSEGRYAKHLSKDLAKHLSKNLAPHVVFPKKKRIFAVLLKIYLCKIHFIS
jgi:lauroyl/myristoyl acyltransferase